MNLLHLRAHQTAYKKVGVGFSGHGFALVKKEWHSGISNSNYNGLEYLDLTISTGKYNKNA